MCLYWGLLWIKNELMFIKMNVENTWKINTSNKIDYIIILLLTVGNMLLIYLNKIIIFDNKSIQLSKLTFDRLFVNSWNYYLIYYYFLCSRYSIIVTFRTGKYTVGRHITHIMNSKGITKSLYLTLLKWPVFGATIRYWEYRLWQVFGDNLFPMDSILLAI